MESNIFRQNRTEKARARMIRVRVIAPILVPTYARSEWPLKIVGNVKNEDSAHRSVDGI